MARNAIVYESRNRLTGTLMRTIDSRHPDAAKLNPPLPKRTKAQEGHRYAAQCVDHKVTVFFQEHYPAGRAIAHSADAVKDEAGTQGWCPKCVAMAKEGKKVTKAKVEAPAATKAPVAKSNGKRTSNKTANRQASRRAAAAAAPGPVVTRTAEPTETPAPKEPVAVGAEG